MQHPKRVQDKKQIEIEKAGSKTLKEVLNIVENIQQKLKSNTNKSENNPAIY